MGGVGYVRMFEDFKKDEHELRTDTMLDKRQYTKRDGLEWKKTTTRQGKKETHEKLKERTTRREKRIFFFK